MTIEPDTFTYLDASPNDREAMREILLYSPITDGDGWGDLPDFDDFARRLRDLNRWAPVYRALEAGEIAVAPFVRVVATEALSTVARSCGEREPGATERHMRLASLVERIERELTARRRTPR